MSSRLLRFSLVLNLILLGVAGYWAGKNPAGESPLPITGTTNRLTGNSPEFVPPASTLAATPVLLRWDELESEDYPTYVANLRRAGCPEPVLRRIIGAELQELYAQKGFALVREFHRDFWKIAARENVRAYFEKTLSSQVKALAQESDALLVQLVGEAPREPAGARMNSATESRFTDFLPPVQREQLRRLAERYGARQQAVRQANLPPEEKTFRLAELQREMEAEQARLFSPEEWAEYQLRQSDAARELRELYGVDFSEAELRKVAQAIDDYRRQAASQPETDPEMLEQKLQSVLGPARYADLNRARSASYRELCEVAVAFGRPRETAAEIFDLRLRSEKQCEEIRADKSRTAEEKQALLDGLQEQVEQTVLTKFGTGAYQSYRARDGRWLNALGRL